MHNNIKITLSLICLTLLILFAANALDLIPDTVELKIRERARTSELIATQISAEIQHNQLNMIPVISKVINDREAEILSIVVKKFDGSIFSNSGNGKSDASLKSSTINHMAVPLFKDNKPWGVVEVLFVPMYATNRWIIIESTFFRLVIFTILFGFFLYFILIRRVLTHLDPYKVIPVRVKLALNAVSDGMVFIDEDENIVLSNHAFENKFNHTEKDLMGLKLSSLGWIQSSDDEDLSKLLPWLETLTNDRSINKVKLKYKSDNNSSLTVLVNSTPLHNKEDKVCGVLTSFTDVTDLEKLNIELENMTRFLQHEMNNAVLGASGAVNIIQQKEQLSEGGQHLITRTQRLHNVIKYLLDSTKQAINIKSTFSKEDKRPLRIDTLVADSVRNYSDIYSKNKFSYKSDNKELVIFGQEERLIEMIDKLTANAIDYSIPGSIITLSCHKYNNLAVLSVRNEGALLPDNKEKIFELFVSFQEKNDNEQNQGIGLYAVKLIAESLGGSVKAKDRTDIEGAEFIIELPLHE